MGRMLIASSSGDMADVVGLAVSILRIWCGWGGREGS